MGKYYSESADYLGILENVHSAMINKFKRNTDVKAAKELQTILQDIKKTAKKLNVSKDSSPVLSAMEQEYKELIDNVFDIQKNYHNGNLKATTLFWRDSRTKTITDNIFEEDLAAILAALEKMSNNSETASVQIETFLTGRESSGTKATKIFEDKFEEGERLRNILTDLAKVEKKRIDSMHVQNAAVKIDVSGKNANLQATKSLGVNLDRLRELMKDATFSAKQYSSFYNGGIPEKISFRLGNTNIYKAITGSLSELMFSTKEQKQFFYRGIQTIIHNNHNYRNDVRSHFSHLRFIYELRGSGILDKSNHVTSAKYIIYNDPHSEAIYVRDTASIILDTLIKNQRGNNLLGNIYLSVSKVKS